MWCDLAVKETLQTCPAIDSTNRHRQDQRLLAVSNPTLSLYIFYRLRTLSQIPSKSKNRAIFMTHGSWSRLQAPAINTFIYVKENLKSIFRYHVSTTSNFRRVVFVGPWQLDLPTCVIKPVTKTPPLFFGSHFFTSWNRRRIQNSPIERKHRCTCNMGKQECRFYLFRDNHRHRKPRPNIPPQTPLGLSSSLPGCLPITSCGKNRRRGTMVATVVCRYFPSAKRKSQ